MRTVLVSFQVASERVREGIENYLRSQAGWWTHLPGLWLIVTESKPREIMELFKHFMIGPDRVFLIEIDMKANKPSGWLPQLAWNWLEDPASALAVDGFQSGHEMSDEELFELEKQVEVEIDDADNES